MKVFEIKTTTSCHTYLVVAEDFKGAIETLRKGKGVHDSTILMVQQLEPYRGEHILLDEALTDRKKIEAEVRLELASVMPQWRRIPDGISGGTEERYLIRHARGCYSLSKGLGGHGQYLMLDALEQLPGLTNQE